MIYLSGGMMPVLPPNVGQLLTPMGGHRLRDDVPWAADTGCFSTPHEYRDDWYLSWLDKKPRDRCLFATAPDVVGDAVATFGRSLPMLGQIRALGFPAALVAQDGLESLDVPWDDMDALFVGGTTAWKLSEVAYALVAEARRRGKWTHMGRVNSWQRFRAAYVSGYHSADGTHLAFRPEKYGPIVERWGHRVRAQPVLFEVA